MKNESFFKKTLRIIGENAGYFVLSLALGALVFIAIMA